MADLSEIDVLEMEAEAEAEAELQLMAQQAEVAATADDYIKGSIFDQPTRDDSGAVESSMVNPDILMSGMLPDVASGFAGAAGKDLAIGGTNLLLRNLGRTLTPGGIVGTGIAGALASAELMSHLTGREPWEEVPSALSGAAFSSTPIKGYFKKKLEPYSYTNVGKTAYAKAGIDKELAERIDPGRTKLTASLQPTVSSYEEAAKASTMNTLNELQDTGYLDDVVSIKDFRDKLSRDFGKVAPMVEELPDGTVTFSNTPFAGRLGTKYRSLVESLANKEAERGTTPITLNQLKKAIENNTEAFVEKYLKKVEDPDVFRGMINGKVQILEKALGVEKPLGLELGDDIPLSFDTLNDLKIKANAYSGQYQQKLFKETPIEGDALKILSNTYLKLEEAQARKIDPKLFSDFQKTKRLYENGLAVRKYVDRAYGRMINQEGGGNSVRLPMPSKSGLLNQLREWAFPPETAEHVFAQSQIAAKLRGLPIQGAYDLAESGVIGPTLGLKALGSLGTMGRLAVSPTLAGIGGRVGGIAGRAAGQISSEAGESFLAPLPVEAQDFASREYQLPRDSKFWDIDPILLGQLNFEPQDFEQLNQLRESPEIAKERFLATLTKKYPTFFQKSPLPGFNVVEGKIPDPLEALTYAEGLRRKIKDPVILARYLSPLNEDGSVLELARPIPVVEPISKPENMLGGPTAEISSPTMGSVKRNESEY